MTNLPLWNHWSMLLICQSTTMGVYGAWIRTYFVLCSRTCGTFGGLIWFPTGSRQAARSARICETDLFTSHWWISLIKASCADLWCFFFYLRLSKRLSKQSRRRWFETLFWPSWRHCNASPETPLMHFRTNAARVLFLKISLNSIWQIWHHLPTLFFNNRSRLYENQQICTDITLNKAGFICQSDLRV